MRDKHHRQKAELSTISTNERRLLSGAQSFNDTWQTHRPCFSGWHAPVWIPASGLYKHGKVLRPESIIALHDCLPPGFYMTSRDIADANHPHSAFPGWWAGDVWKIVPTLKQYRPELSITITDSAPTGLVVITRLDPANETFSVNYEKIIAAFEPIDRNEFTRYWASVPMVSAGSLDLQAFQPFQREKQ
ncbi:hypothetical protein [Mesorhizobium sp.]|uniref:hypothetical protein n=1 Tax=Mesorhizobium sp. TaxID=1871066 RepID=UPI0025C0BA13|nr:hypothetical protein [Mesorhizobium sp.]